MVEFLGMVKAQDTGVITSSCLWKWKCQKTAMCGPCTEVLGFIPASSGKDTGKTPLDNSRPTSGARRLTENKIGKLQNKERSFLFYNLS